MATKGTIIFSSPVFTGNAKKKLFTRKEKDNLKVKLPAIPRSSDVAKSKMDTLQTRFDEDYWTLFGDNTSYLKKRNSNSYGRGRDWEYTPLLDVKFKDALNNENSYWDLRPGICIHRDTQSMIPMRNYSLESIFKGSEFTLNFDMSHLNAKDRYKALVVLNEWEEGRFFFGEGKSRGLGRGKAVIDWKDINKSDYTKEKDRSGYNKEANYIELTVRLPLSEPLLINWNYEIFNYGKEFYVDDRNSGKEIGALLESEERHKEAAEEARRKGGFIEYKGKRVDRYNLEKAAINDRNVINFFKNYGEKLREYLDNNEFKDYREKSKLLNKDGYDKAKNYDKLPVRLLTKEGFGEIYIPGATLKGAFRTRAQQIIKTLFQSGHCNVGTGGTSDRRCPDRCMVCEIFGKMGDRSKVFFRDAYPVGEVHLYPADSVPICRISGKGLNKSNLLFAYNPEAYMETKILIKNIKDKEVWMLALLGHIFKDLASGDIPLGSGKWCGLGRLKGEIASVETGCHNGSWLYGSLNKLGVKLTPGFFWDNALFDFSDVSNYSGLLDEWQEAFLKRGDMK